MAQSQPPPDDPPAGCFRTADLLGALSLAADLGVGLPAEHAVRSCYIGMHIAERLRLPSDQRADLYYAELLMDAGCTAWTSQLAASIVGDEIIARREFVFFSDRRNPLDVLSWLKDYMAAGSPAHLRAQRVLHFALHGPESVREGFKNTCEVAQRFAQRLGMAEGVQTALLSVFEQWDGNAPNGIRGTLIPIASRIVYATSFLEAFHRIGGAEAAHELARRRRGTAFDPSVVDAFMASATDPAFWEGLDRESVWPIVSSMEPRSPRRYLPEEKLDDVARSFADFADLKSRYAIGHSRRVADLAERLARQMMLPDSETTTIRRAALMHDIGLVAVPSYTLEKPRATLTQVEWEQLRLHPYHAERILSLVPVLAPVVPLVAAHHERMDGRGYYRGLSGSQIPLGARILAVADRFDELCHDGPERQALDPECALNRICDDQGSDLCPDVCRALIRMVGVDGPATAGRERRRKEWPAGLSDREVEILRLLARGMSRRQMARQLFLSEHTVRHHLEHIYTKIDVNTRVAATLFAVEHGLLL